MTEPDGRGKPTPDELRAIVGSRSVSGDFRITPRITDIEAVFPAIRMSEDTDEALADQARTAYDDQHKKHVEVKGHIELLGKLARLNFIRGSLGYGDHRLARHLRITTTEKDQRGDYRLAQYLGITANQIQRGDLRGRRKKEIKRFKQRFDGLFALSSILAESVEDVIDRRIALETPNGKLSNVSVSDAIKAGYINIAVAIALEAVRQNESSRDNQRVPESPLG